MYNKKYIQEKGHRIIREIYAYIKLKNEYDSKKIYNKKGIGFASILEHGILDSDTYFMIITRVDGEELFETVVESKNHIWENINNIYLFCYYCIKALSILYTIFGENFRHNDFHPSNIFVNIINNRVVQISVIDFDLLDSDCFYKDLGIKLPNDSHHTNNQWVSGLTTVVRTFMCFCFDYNKNKNISQSSYLCLNTQTLITYANDIQNIDIKHWYIIGVSLIKLYESLHNCRYRSISRSRSRENGNLLCEIKMQNYDFLKKIFDSYYENRHGKLPTDFDFDPYFGNSKIIATGNLSVNTTKSIKAGNKTRRIYRSERLSTK